MREETRRAIANAVLPMDGLASRALYSQTANAWTSFSATENGFFDHGAGAHIARTDGGLYHHGLAAHILLTLDGTQFSGFDHLTGARFAGVVQGTTVIVRDAAAGREHHLYRLAP